MRMSSGVVLTEYHGEEVHPRGAGSGGVWHHDDVDGMSDKVNVLIYPKDGLAEGGGNDSLSVCNGPVSLESLLKKQHCIKKKQEAVYGDLFAHCVLWSSRQKVRRDIMHLGSLRDKAQGLRDRASGFRKGGSTATTDIIISNDEEHV
ncbi:hypothetical protein QYE76_013162 [Lolium multiflorum]|uniref:Uncharacterized protein n=1 Tax=Lolium multiflorum TaxID=4521 RepID=A0AAD8U2J4_LOLMU|nr:hypothetical protein QYE76_013162 [Lolium multiflorum]